MASSVRRPANRRALRSPNAPDLPEGAKWTRARSSTLLHATSRCWYVLVAICCMNSQHALRQPTSASRALASNQLSMQIIIQADSQRCLFLNHRQANKSIFVLRIRGSMQATSLLQWNWEVSLAEHALRSNGPNRESNRITYKKHWKTMPDHSLGIPPC